MDIEKIILEFAKAASANGWDVTLGKGTSELPNDIRRRYGTIPQHYQVFLENVRSCVKDTQRTKFYCQDDYFSKDSVFLPYNGLEERSFSICDSEAEKANVRRYWDSMFTIACGLNGFNYLTLSTASNDFGAVYYGWFEYAEEGERIADSFGEYLAELTLFHTGVRELEVREYIDFM